MPGGDNCFRVWMPNFIIDRNGRGREKIGGGAQTSWCWPGCGNHPECRSPGRKAEFVSCDQPGRPGCHGNARNHHQRRHSNSVIRGAIPYSRAGYTYPIRAGAGLSPAGRSQGSAASLLSGQERPPFPERVSRCSVPPSSRYSESVLSSKRRIGHARLALPVKSAP